MSEQIIVNSILEKIRAARELKSTSQQEIADALEITQSSYAKMERGYCKMNVDNLIKIIKYLQIDIYELFDTSYQSNIQALRNDLSPNQQLENTVNRFPNRDCGN